jgi:hypothetical protein
MGANIRRMRYGISLNNDTMQTVHTLPIDYSVSGSEHDEWAAGIESSVRTVRSRKGDMCYSKHEVTEAGLYTLRIYMVDDGLVLQKILLGTNTLERMETSGRGASVSCDPETRERRQEKTSVTFPTHRNSLKFNLKSKHIYIKNKYISPISPKFSLKQLIRTSY